VRTYTDRNGDTWLIYLVAPTGGVSPHLLPPEFQSGWLCFERGHDKRRLAPVPDDWEFCDEQRLETYLEAAVVAEKRLAPTSEGRNMPLPPHTQCLQEIEHFFTRRLPSSLSLALDRLADLLEEPDAPSALRGSVPDLRRAAVAAAKGDYDGARSLYREAAAPFSADFGAGAKGAE
jgi:hypothetical protein